MNVSEYRRGQIDAHATTHQHESCPGRVAFLQHLLKLIPQGVDRLLEIGCHNGHETKHLRERARDVYALELGEQYLEQARRRAKREGWTDVEWCQGDMHELDLLFIDDTFDVVFANNVLEHAMGQRGAESVLHTILLVLKPGGVLVGAVPPDALGVGQRELAYHTWKVTPKELRDTLEGCSFEVTFWEVMERVDRRFPGVTSPASLQQMVVFSARAV